MRVIVCGGRDYYDLPTLSKNMDALQACSDPPISMVITGGAAGADNLAHRWALRRGIPTVQCEANWNAHGKRAGWIRNNTMAQLEPDLVVAFTGGRGTAMMIEIAEARKIKVIRCT
jgi:predicted Rossmann-fold nucleotide-binding protein